MARFLPPACRALKQLRLSAHGEPLSVLELVSSEIPSCPSSGMLVRFLMSPINPADINQIEGTYKKLPPLPAVAGNEGWHPAVFISWWCLKDARTADQPFLIFSCAYVCLRVCLCVFLCMCARVCFIVLCLWDRCRCGGGCSGWPGLHHTFAGGRSRDSSPRLPRCVLSFEFPE